MMFHALMIKMRFSMNALYFVKCLLLVATNSLDSGYSMADIELSIPSTHTTLKDNLPIRIKSSLPQPLSVSLSTLEGTTIQPLTNFSISPELTDYNSNFSFLKLPCGYFSRNRKYYILVKKKDENIFSIDPVEKHDNIQSTSITQTIAIQQHMPQLIIMPEIIQTYPKTPVTATLEFPEVICPPSSTCLTKESTGFQLELRYCGHSPSLCNIFSRRNDSLQALYAQQIWSFPSRQNISLECKYFGLAGHYAVLLKATHLNSWLLLNAAFLKADWSEEFVFNVHTQSIFPCDRHNGGITVLFQYPACILLTGDRIRLFARHRTDVAALVPPTTLEYVAEQKVLKGSNKLKFDCDLFTERYIEYCFVYVSQAITGAVADVRMDCVPTLPVREYKRGGWGPWSAWTPCSSTCIGGMKSRFRLCDSPQPRFGGKFCKGHAVETEKCGTEIGNIWECLDGNFDTPSVKQEVGLFCRCGCVVHLGRANPKRVLAASSRSCPGRIFWQIQADLENIIQFRIEWFESSCGRQWLKIRDGMTLSSNMLADLSNHLKSNTSVVNSSGSTMLLEFSSDDSLMNDHLCEGGFLAFAQQLENIQFSIVSKDRQAGITSFKLFKLTAIHSTSIFFLSGIFIALALLAAQYTFRYRKYHATYTEDQDSITDPSVSCASLISRRSSNSTIFSEVFSLQRSQRGNMVSKSSDHQIGFEQNNVKGRLQFCSSQFSEKQSNRITIEEIKLAKITDEETGNVISSCPTEGINTNKMNLTERKAIQGLQDNNTPHPTKGLYSSSRRIISTAKIRNMIPKETKDKSNRAKLLAGPCGSDFSICGNEMDLEIDYYDYNVRNAGAAPGSYLGMDPAFLIYIPPLYISGEFSPSENENVRHTPDETPSNQYEIEEENFNETDYPPNAKRTEEQKKTTGGVAYKNNFKEKNENNILDIQSIGFESKLVRLQLQELTKFNENEKKIEEFPMIDSNILDEIRYADEEEDDKQ